MAKETQEVLLRHRSRHEEKGTEMQRHGGEPDSCSICTLPGKDVFDSDLDCDSAALHTND
jgi:hypothetical protein